MDVKLPRLGEGAESGTVVNILVTEGQRIQKDQNILELENEKAVAPIPSPVDGIVRKIHVKEGDEISVGQLLVSLAEDGSAEPAVKEETTRAPSKPRTTVEKPAAEEPAEAKEHRYESRSGVGPPAAPSIRKMARELGIDLSRIRGTEQGGRITLADVRAYIGRLQELAFSAKPGRVERLPEESIDFSKWGPVTKKRMSPLRRTVAERTSDAWRTIPHITQFDEADVTDLVEMRKKYVRMYEEKGAHLTLTILVLKAVIGPLKKCPIFNASLDEATQEIVYKDYYHLGVAVDTDAGLIVPVLRDVDKKSLLDLSLEVSELAEKARQRKVSLEELQGGTFTVSNLGGIGGTHFTPIINKPQVAVIGLGKGTLKPVVRAGKIEARTILEIGLSYDHRLIDGADGARFVRELVHALENFSEEQLKL
ncbi:MAG: 2-oxo acid dehydrogenase subunit E2 [Candidatus Binatia bacterium]